MKIEYFEEFLELAKCGNYALAAENLYMSDSSLSRHIIALERELGIELFTRTSRNVVLNDNGRMLVPYAEKVIDLQRQIKVCFEDRANTNPRITIGFTQAAVQYGLMKKLLQFKADNPDINVSIFEDYPSSLTQMLKSGEINFAICYEYYFLSTPEIKSTSLVMDEMAVAVPAGHPLGKNKSISLKQLENQPLIMHNRSSASCRHVMELFQEDGIKPNAFTYVQSGYYLLELVVDGGVALVEKKRFEKSRPSNVSFIDIVPTRYKSFSLFHKDKNLSEAEARFANYMISDK